VYKRLAEHNGRKNSPAAGSTSHLAQTPGASSRAAAAAARVAARYAKAPSYSEMLASEARAAVRAAEAASWAALEAQAAAETLLAGLEAAAIAGRPQEREVDTGVVVERAREQVWEAADLPAAVAAPKSTKPVEEQSFGILWDADMPVRQAEPEAVRATHNAGVSGSSAEDWRQGSTSAPQNMWSEDIEVVEPAQPIHANLIEFPRELVATRKIRPRRVEGTHAGIGNAVGQLSIFEVDPESISFEPAAAEIVTGDAPAWPGPGWSSIQLGEQSLDDKSYNEESRDALADAEVGTVQAAAARAIDLAPIGRRLMAAVVDGALIAGISLAAAMAAMNEVKILPTVKEIELGAAVTLTVFVLLYYLFFFTRAAATPGMKWAGLSLRTFSGEKPTRSQRLGRLWALALSLLPVGLGVVWAIFDDERLCWHDRLSETYVRKC